LIGLAVVFQAMHPTGYIRAEIPMKDVLARTQFTFRGAHASVTTTRRSVALKGRV